MEATRKLEALLEKTLMNLPSSSFKSFKNKLIGYKKITVHDLELAGREEVVTKIIRCYTTKRGPEIVIKVLKAINENQAALELKTELETINTAAATKKKTPGSQKKPPTAKEKKTPVKASAATKKKTPGSQKKPRKSATAKEKKTPVKASAATKKKTPGSQKKPPTGTKKKASMKASTAKEKKTPVKASTARKKKTPVKTSAAKKKTPGSQKKPPAATKKKTPGSQRKPPLSQMISPAIFPPPLSIKNSSNRPAVWFPSGAAPSSTLGTSPTFSGVSSSAVGSITALSQMISPAIFPSPFSIKNSSNRPAVWFPSGAAPSSTLGTSPTFSGVSSSAVGSITGRQHFVDRHRAALIARVSLIDPILDELLGDWTLTQEQYDTVRSNRTPQKKMRKLYAYVRAWGRDEKDKFYRHLLKHNGPLVRDLENN
ncbi:neurofilament heavy polypeptide-like isoform X2 [Xenopus tropicalis]|uniref:Neurofilament heavy polypeptide-like n=1 Tax=Xenopus tropicalis TaxID=8364 RepID=A0A803JSI7_XENTR|nr:neurofilament heavy polypeptide-like isoform X2 [Xenopus tropicalis]